MAHQAQVSGLEKQRAAAENQIQNLRSKLQELEKERNATAETLRTRESALLEELDQKKQLWAASNEALKEQLAGLQSETSQKDKGRQSRIAQLEKAQAEATEQLQTLRDRQQRLEKERQDLTGALKAREDAYQAELLDA